MDIRKLEIFTTVAKLGSFSEASRQLHMAQPAVSIAIRKLEEQTGCPLLHRHRRNIQLTAEGEVAYHQALKVLAEMESFKNQLREVNTLVTGTVTLLCPAGQLCPARTADAFSGAVPKPERLSPAGGNSQYPETTGRTGV